MDIHTLARSGDHAQLEKALNCGDLTKSRSMCAVDDSLKRKPIHLAAYFGHLEAVKVLLKYTDESVEAMDGFTALHFAAQQGHPAIVSLLLKSCPNVNRKTHKSLTALHLACSKWKKSSTHEKVIHILIEKGADLTLQSKTGMTAVDSVLDAGLRGELKRWISERTGGRRKRPSDEMTNPDNDTPGDTKTSD